MDDKKSQTCCFTGHRVMEPELRDIIVVRAEGCIRDLILKRGVRYFGVGGAIGFDSLVAEILFRLRSTEFPHIKVILVYPFEGYTACWTAAQRAKHERMLPMYDKRVCVAQEGGREAYIARNRHLVDNSAYCICYLERQTGGTAYTVEYATKKRLTVINVLDEKEGSNE